jgi:hypothetical protein
MGSRVGVRGSATGRACRIAAAHARAVSSAGVTMTDGKRPRVAAIIPAWNEAGAIGLVVAALPRDLVDLRSSSTAARPMARTRLPAPPGRR